MAVNTTFGWAQGVGLVGVATAWATTAGMAYYAILKRRIPIYKEWMVRAYVVTFAFVTFRLLHDYSPLSRRSQKTICPLRSSGLLGLFRCWSPKSSCNSGA
jgi:hypothetical protein